MPGAPRPAPKGTASDPDGAVAFSGPPESGTPAHNLPYHLSSFVGRQREVARVKGLLTDNRLVTLTGPGGSGKSRLALAAAAELLGRFEGGVWFAELAPISDPEIVPQVVASVLGVREMPGGSLADSLRVHLEPREVLIVLDNCEHLVDACAAFVEGLLRSCPTLRFLATSREALGVLGEVLFAVPPLALPDPRRLTNGEGLAGYEAVALFAERARAVKPDFAVTEDNATTVAQVCYRLDGIPLAIEFAAARTKALSVEQISARLDDAFALLTSGGRVEMPHHRTLRATMDWSYDLLPGPEQDLLARLSVFAGTFALEAAEAVAGSAKDGAVLDPIASLVDKSLVAADDRGGETRYGLLETVRQYGGEKLEGSGEAPEVRRAHAGYFLRLAEGAEPELRGGQGGRWLEYLEEHDNFRAALSWALEHGEAEIALRLAASLGEFWYLGGHLAEGRRWLEAALAEGDGESKALRVKALTWAGAMRWITREQADYERLVDLGEEALALAREIGTQAEVAHALQTLAYAESQRNHLDRASALAEQAIGLQRASADTGGLARSLPVLGFVALARHDYARATAVYGESMALAQEAEDNFAIAVSLVLGALAYAGAGDIARARSLCRRGLDLTWDLRMMPMVSGHLNVSTVLAAWGGRPSEVARLWGAAETLRESLNISLAPIERSYYNPPVESARSRVDRATWEAARAEGADMSPERAVEYARQTLDEPEETETPLQGYPANLSAREVEVLRLLARGLTNARIAKELYISPRTVNAHLGSVYRKIGTNTRAEAARFASEHGLLP